MGQDGAVARYDRDWKVILAPVVVLLAVFVIATLLR